MPYNRVIAQRVREILADRDDVDERPVFGGLAFRVRGRFCVGVRHDDLIVRLGEGMAAALLTQPHARVAVWNGRPVKGLLYVGEGGLADPVILRRWVESAIAFVDALPERAVMHPPAWRARTSDEGCCAALP